MKKMTKKEDLEVEINNFAGILPKEPAELRAFFLHICVDLLAYGFLTGRRHDDNESFNEFEDLLFKTAEQCNNLYQNS